jgi:hypothetical protein
MIFFEQTLWGNAPGKANYIKGIKKLQERTYSRPNIHDLQLIQSNSTSNTLGLLGTIGVFTLPDGIRPNFLGLSSPLPLPSLIRFTGLGRFPFFHLPSKANFHLLLFAFFLFIFPLTMCCHLYLASWTTSST